MTSDSDVLAQRDTNASPSDEAQFTATLRAQFGTSIKIKSRDARATSVRRPESRACWWTHIARGRS